jgi:hypothetical protein
MSEHDEPAKPALSKDNPDPPRGTEGDKGLGSETDAEGAAADSGDDVTKDMPKRRGEVRYPDVEDPDEHRPTAVPQEGHVEKNPDTSDDASTGAKD